MLNFKKIKVHDRIKVKTVTIIANCVVMAAGPVLNPNFKYDQLGYNITTRKIYEESIN